MGFWPGYTVGIAGRMKLVISRGFHNAFFSLTVFFILYSAIPFLASLCVQLKL
jgi:hypothetical protein